MEGNRRTGPAGRPTCSASRYARCFAFGTLVFLGLGFLPAASAWGPPTYVVRDDKPDAPALTGTLTWNDGKGSISWSTSPATEEMGGRGGQPGANPPPEEFRSEPLPMKLDLNVSRLVKLDLPVQTGQDPSKGCGLGSLGVGLKVELLAGERLLAGGVDGGVVFDGRDPVIGPPSPISLCRYRMPVEMRQLPAGTVLVLRISYYPNNGPYRFPLAGEHEAKLTLPYYSPSEAYWRYRTSEEAHPSTGTTRAGGASEYATSSGLNPLLSVGGLFSFGGRGRRAPLVVGLVVATFLAGCVSDAPGAPQDTSNAPAGDDQAKVRVDRATDPALAPKGRGSILGVVRDDVYVPVTGAYVSLLGGANASTTDGQGRFQILGVTPGSYLMRVDKAGYRSVETHLEVVAGSVTSVEVELLPAFQKPIDARAHRHDYWAGKTSKEAFNASMGSCAAYSSSECEGDEGFYLRPISASDRNLVLPGTYEMEIILDWNPQVFAYARLGLMMQPNSDPSGINWTAYIPRDPGVPFRIPMSWEMGDVGHQQFSTVRFAIQALQEERATAQMRMSESAALHVTIRLFKGVVPLEPAHPDHWGSATVLPLQSGLSWKSRYNGPTAAATIDSSSASGGCWTDPAKRSLDDPNRPPGTTLLMDWGSPNRVVPPGTGHVRLEMVASYAPAAYGFVLWYKSGEKPFARFDPDGGVYAQATSPTVTDGGKHYVWNLSVTAPEADGIYNRRSAWSFIVTPSDLYLACAEAHAHALTSDPLSLTWSSIAIRSAKA